MKGLVIIMETIFTRRSVRTYLDKKIEAEKLDKILKAGMQAPSGANQQPWEFLVLKSDEALKILKDYLPNANMVQEAGAIIIVLEKTDVRVPYFTHQDLGACTQNILLQVADLGLGACWIGVQQGERVDFLRKAFNLPDGINPFSILTIGYPTTDDANKFVDRYDETRVHYNTY